jgi:hypothetical protein
MRGACAGVARAAGAWTIRRLPEAAVVGGGGAHSGSCACAQRAPAHARA